MTQKFTLHSTAIQLEAKIRANRLLNLPVSWESEVVYPHYGGLSIYNIAQTVAAGFGLVADAPLDAAVWGGETPLNDINRIVLIIIDGLGYQLLNAMLAEDAELCAAVGEITQGRGVLPLTSVAASTTAVALTTLWTAKTPAAHGMLGTTMFLREFALLANMLYYTPDSCPYPPGTLNSWGIKAADFVQVEALGQLLEHAGVPTHLVLDMKLMGSGLSVMLHRGITRCHLHAGAQDSWMRLRDVLAATAGQRCFVGAYWPAVDDLSHLYGMNTAYLQREVKQQFMALRDVLVSDAVADGHTLVFITADHGHHDVKRTINLEEDERARPIREALRLAPAGDTRFAQFYLREGYRQSVINVLAHDFADQLAWIEPKVALEVGLFGQEAPHPEFFHRTGDLIVISRLGAQVVKNRRSHQPVSTHGGLSDWEMLVPFLWRRI